MIIIETSTSISVKPLLNYCIQLPKSVFSPVPPLLRQHPKYINHIELDLVAGYS